jgi:hypothetical protein
MSLCFSNLAHTTCQGLLAGLTQIIDSLPYSYEAILPLPPWFRGGN